MRDIIPDQQEEIDYVVVSCAWRVHRSECRILGRSLGRHASRKKEKLGRQYVNECRISKQKRDGAPTRHPFTCVV